MSKTQQLFSNKTVNEIIKQSMVNQPIKNIGAIGHVSHGKTTIVKVITEKDTKQFKKEQKENKTLKLGYAGAKIYKCDSCPEPECYKSTPSNIFELKCAICGMNMELKTHVSFVDCPGHNMLMSTMLNGTCVMDYTLLVQNIADKEIPSPQTVEHLKATKIVNVPNKIVCYNKLDLLLKNDALVKINKMNTYLENTIAKDSIKIPVVASMGINVDVLLSAIANTECPDRNLDSFPKMIIIRTFDVNKPGTAIEKLKGGVVGGSLTQGIISINDNMEIRPGFTLKNENYDNENDDDRRFKYYPLKCKVMSIESEQNELKYAIPGGLIGIGLDIDPSVTSQDKLIGSLLLNCNDEEHRVFEEIQIKFTSFDENGIDFLPGEIIHLNVNASNTCGIYREMYKKKYMVIELTQKPICVKLKDKITISRKNSSSLDSNGLHTVGFGIVINGIESLIY